MSQVEINIKKTDILNGLKERMKGFSEAGILVALVLLCTVISLANPAFYSSDNVINLLRQTSYIIVVTLITTMVIIIGGLDLSVGSIIGFSGITVSVMMTNGLPIWLSIVIAIAISAIFGLFNGITIVRFKIPSLIVTLGTLYIARGLCNAITKGVPVYPLPEKFAVIGNGDLFGVPYSVFFVILISIITDFVLRRTTYGRSIYAIGGNEETARLSGIRTDALKISVYVLSSISAAIAGIILTSRMTSGQTSLGTGWELTVIASAVIGGTSMLGGSGTVLGSILGAMLMAVIANGMILMSVSVYWQSVVIGSIIIAAVAIDIYRKKKSGLDMR